MERSRAFTFCISLVLYIYDHIRRKQQVHLAKEFSIKPVSCHANAGAVLVSSWIGDNVMTAASHALNSWVCAFIALNNRRIDYV
ncbi:MULTISPECIES: hypothetical protein [unclassified Iodidimonas]|uniref:hypothetical protein n=1 Tax=unclassified Iodidimonas TaxID=2626145 RepID=UPI002482D91C|nr:MULTISPECIES: hypothetical protein [unclassified Iodidimonas]